MFKTPTLRNVATRHVFFHNGLLKSLRDVIRFYNTRDTQPERLVSDRRRRRAEVRRPAAEYRSNIDTQRPLDGRAPGATPAMSEQDIDDLKAFLVTLTDADQAPPRDPLVSPAVRLLLWSRPGGR